MLPYTEFFTQENWTLSNFLSLNGVVELHVSGKHTGAYAAKDANGGWVRAFVAKGGSALIVSENALDVGAAS